MNMDIQEIIYDELSKEFQNSMSNLSCEAIPLELLSSAYLEALEGLGSQLDRTFLGE